jgi:hypothetical protein
MVLLSQSPFIAEADFNNPRVQQQLDQVKNHINIMHGLGLLTLKVKSKLRQTIYCKVQMYLSGIGLFTVPSEYIWAMYTRLFYSPKNQSH